MICEGRAARRKWVRNGSGFCRASVSRPSKVFEQWLRFFVVQTTVRTEESDQKNHFTIIFESPIRAAVDLGTRDMFALSNVCLTSKKL